MSKLDILRQMISHRSSCLRESSRNKSITLVAQLYTFPIRTGGDISFRRMICINFCIDLRSHGSIIAHNISLKLLYAVYIVCSAVSTDARTWSAAKPQPIDVGRITLQDLAAEVEVDIYRWLYDDILTSFALHLLCTPTISTRWYYELVPVLALHVCICECLVPYLMLV